jgi:4-oxalocrotonate tautomerase family enzyme
MPFISVKLIGPMSEESKKAMAEGITDVIEKKGGKPRDQIWIVFEEFARKDWMIAGKPI